MTTRSLPPQPVLLIIGFEAFGRRTVNSSEQLTRQLASNPPKIGPLSLCAYVLPVSWAETSKDVRRLITVVAPCGLMMFGEHGGGIRVERQAFGIGVSVSRDNKGKRSMPRRLGSNLRRRTSASIVKRLVSAARSSDVKASRFADLYLCNAAYYSALGSGTCCVFVHLPRGGLTPGVERACRSMVESFASSLPSC